VCAVSAVKQGVGQHDNDVSRLSTTPKRPAKRPAKSSHRGVRLLAPDARRKHWRVRFRDPDTNTLSTEVVPAYVHDSKEGRAHYASQRLRRLQRSREDIAAGAAPHVQAAMPLPEAFARYFKEHVNTLRPRTERAYRDPCNAFVAWAGANGLKTVRQLTRGRLKEFVAYARSQTSARGGQLSPLTIKKTLRSVANALNWLHDAEITRLGRDDVRIGLRTSKPAQPEKRPHLEPAEIASLLAVARDHDDVRFKATRHVPYVPDGVLHPTPRYAAIEPVITFLLLSGLRLGELVSLRVSDVKLAHGYFDVRANNTKTKRTRVVRFDVAPSLAQMLGPRVTGRKGDELVFAEHTRGSLNAAMRRLHRVAPRFSYQLLRVTCATYLANMDGAVNESFQLGHAITVAQDFYLGRVRLAPNVRTLEEAMQLTSATAASDNLQS
jgi:integrase